MTKISQNIYTHPTCRVCNSGDLKTLPVCEYAPFFQLRVDITKDPFLLYSRNQFVYAANLSFFTRAWRKAMRIFNKLTSPHRYPFRTSGQYCANCYSTMPSHEYSYEDLAGLYRDYRSDSYNNDRISVEPSYAKICTLVGNNPIEVKNRNAATDRFLNKNSEHLSNGIALDYGGSDGQFISRSVIEHYEAVDIYDVSDALLHDSVKEPKVKKINFIESSDYALLLCMHVFEHVGNPMQFLKEAMKYVTKGGCIYVEVPLELSEVMKQQFEESVIDIPFTVHEHINQFELLSLNKLFESTAGLQLMDSTEDYVDIGWAKVKIGRYLAKKI